MEKLVNLQSYPVQVALQLLLTDKTSNKNIIFATSTYADAGIEAHDEITEESLKKIDLQPRVEKTSEEKSLRTKKKAEVFTPSWIVNHMNNYCDEDWFGRKNVFNVEDDEDHTWRYIKKDIEMPSGKSWQEYVQLLKMEITCGEAPFIVSRYDPATGKRISVGDRIGVLDRKLRIVGEHTKNESEWRKWATKALQSSYGYEFQGDNLLIARINILDTLCKYRDNRFGNRTDNVQIKKWAEIIAWNFWQMDGFSGCIPFRKVKEPVQGELWDEPSKEVMPDYECQIRDWRKDEVLKYNSLKGVFTMKFNYIIGNPPYNSDFSKSGDNGKFAAPVYDKFMEASFKIADAVELIHPARFLFNAGSTNKKWNEKMLNDRHFKVLEYDANSSSVFPNVDIKGGVAITYYAKSRKFVPIKIFTPFNELNNILRKVQSLATEGSLENEVTGRGVYKLSDDALKEHPEIEELQSKGHKKDVGSGAFKVLSNIVFFKEKPSDGKKYVKFLGLENRNRVYWWGKLNYQSVPDSFYHYKVFIPQANGSGAFGEILTMPMIGEPMTGATETFLSIGNFDQKSEAEACLKYIKSKFARAMLGILKTTQANTKSKWKYVPLQDFTSNSDIDWSQSISEIDQQLYAKYGLNDDEIQFIETHVKGMN